jgi:hypothetical protein
VSGPGQFGADVVDGEVAFAHGDDEFADAIACWGLGVRCGLGKEGSAFVRVVAELVAEDAEGARV